MFKNLNGRHWVIITTISNYRLRFFFKSTKVSVFWNYLHLSFEVIVQSRSNINPPAFGAYKTSSINTLCAVVNEPSLYLRCQSLAMLYNLKLKSNPHNPTHPSVLILCIIILKRKDHPPYNMAQILPVWRLTSKTSLKIECWIFLTGPSTALSIYMVYLFDFAAAK